MKILVMFLCLVAMPITLTGCSDFNCRRLMREDCQIAPRKNCTAEGYARCACLKAAKTEYEKKRCDDVSKEFGY